MARIEPGCLAALPLIYLIVLVVGLLLAFSNGANDDFKGVATLLGSGTANYRRTLAWGILSTLAGSFAALFVTTSLVARFSGKGLVPDAIVAEPAFALAAASAGGLTVLSATRFALPISTTHALVGGLVGAGLAATDAGIRWERLASTFLIPLLASPLVAALVTILLVPLTRFVRGALGLTEESCICVGPDRDQPEPVAMAAGLPTLAGEWTAGRTTPCAPENRARVTASGSLDLAHFVSAGTLGFARGLNDTPKIAALLLFAPAISREAALAGVAVVMAIGGATAAGRVGRTVAFGITPMNAGQGFVANAVSTVLVLTASRFGLPVSTTHVSVGSLFGLGAVSGGAHWRSIARIATAWVVTLPVATLLGAASYFAFDAVLD